MRQEYEILSKYKIHSTEETSDSEYKRIVVNDDVTNYELSKDGVLRNIQTKKVLNGFIRRRKGHDYIMFNLRINGEYVYISKHRLLACLFINIPKEYIENGYTQQNLRIKHIDGVKRNCCLDNLKWILPSENDTTSSTIDINLLLNDEKYRLEKIEDFKIKIKTVHKICTLLSETNLSFNQIATKCNVSQSFVSLINSGKRHKEISKLYDLPRKKEPTVTENRIRHACELLQGGSLTIQEISRISGVSRSTIDRLINGLIYLDIAKEYGIVS